MTLVNASRGGLLAALLLAGPLATFAPSFGSDGALAPFWRTPVAAPAAADRSPSPAARLGGSAWSQLTYSPITSRTRCVGLANGGFSLNVGSDECGYWRTDSPIASGFDWSPRGDELGGGVTHIMERYVIIGQTVDRTTVVRQRGAQAPTLHYSDDGGSTWSASTFTTPFEPAQIKRMLIEPNFGNVAYLLAYGYDDNRSEQGWLLARTFTGGASWEEVRFDATASDMDLWSTGTIPGNQMLAVDDGSDVVIEATSDGFDNVSSFYTFSGQGGAGTGVWIAANDVNLNKVWVLAGEALTSYDGNDETYLTDIAEPAPGGICASLSTIDFLMWADGQQVFYSSDGGVSSTALPNSNWSFDAQHVNTVPTNIQCMSAFIFPGAGPGGSVQDRTAARGFIPIERFFISTGAGTYVYAAGDANAMRMTDETMQNLQVWDMATVIGPDRYEFEVGMRDHGEQSFRRNSLPLFPDGAIGSFPNDVGVVATNGQPAGVDPYRFSLFRSGIAIVTGQGEFVGIGLPLGIGSGAFQALVADPSVARRWYYCDTDVKRIDFDPTTNVFTTTSVGPPVSFSAKFGYAVAPSNTLIRYASTLGLGFGAAMARSADGGANWTAHTFSGPVPADDGTGSNARVPILVDPTDPNRVFAAGSGIGVRTTDGTTWTDFFLDLPVGTQVYDLEFQAGDLSRVWAATDRGVFRWNGTTWEDMTPPGSGVPDVPFRTVVADAQQGVMRVGSYGRGIFEYALGGNVSVPGADMNALALAPTQNPMRGRGRLSFSLPVAGRVTLELIDVNGRRVATLDEGQRAAGPHTVAVDARTFGVGVYFARLVSEQGTRTAKLVIAH